MSALQNTRVPVPRTYHLCIDSSIIGTPFYICEFIKGIVYTKAHLPQLKSQQRYAIYAEINRVLSNIHSVNLKEVGLTDFSSSKKDHISRTISRWNKQFNASKTDETSQIPELNEFYKQINNYNDNKRKDISDNIISLVHGDFKLDNVIFCPSSFRILAVIDWELSTIGNPLTDLSTFCLCYHHQQIQILL